MMINKVSIIEKIPSFIDTFLYMLFNPPNLDLIFPFVTLNKSNLSFPFPFSFPTFGILCFPIMWFLFYVRKITLLRNFIFAGIFISLLNIALFAFVGIFWRYNIDFAWILALGALICAFQLQEKYTAMRKVVLKIFYSCCGITLLLVFFFTISVRITGAWENYPRIYYYLARAFGVICNVP